MARHRLLVIEDDAAIAETMIDIAAGMGWEARAASSGRAATLAREWHPNVITLDIAMPGLDGWALRTLLAQHPQTRAIPVVIVTGVPPEHLDEHRMQAFAIVSKPFDISVMERVLLAAVSQGDTPCP